jgi:hypothetical protein
MSHGTISTAQISTANSLLNSIPPSLVADLILHFSGAARNLVSQWGQSGSLMRAVEFDAASICIQGIALCRVLVVYFVRLSSLLWRGLLAWWCGSDGAPHSNYPRVRIGNSSPVGSR